MKRLVFSILLLVSVISNTGQAQKKLWADRIAATREYMQKHMWNAGTGNFVRRADMPNVPGSDAWGITIVLDAYAYLVESGLMKPDELKQYFLASSSLYEKTNGIHGARILARQGSQIYVGGDDDMQWCAALVHCFEATKDTEYLETAKFAFNALIDLGFWKNGESKGWAWNSSDQRPNGVSTAYGALAAARLLRATNESVYEQWTVASLNALETPQVGFFPRDMMVAVNAAVTYVGTMIPDNSSSNARMEETVRLTDRAISDMNQVLAGRQNGEINPTDIGDLAEGLHEMSSLAKVASFSESTRIRFLVRGLRTSSYYQSQAKKIVTFFLDRRTNQDIAEHGFFSRYDIKGHPVLSGSYLGVPLNVPFLPEVAEMLKLFAAAYAEEAKDK